MIKKQEIYIYIYSLFRRIEKMLKKMNASYSVEELENAKEDYTREYSITTNQAILKVFVGNKGLGYDLGVKKEVLDIEIGTFLDTDLYPLDEENLEFYNEIFDETLLCIEALLEHRIFIGKINKKYILAIPVSKDIYRLEEKGRWFNNISEIDKLGLLAVDGLYPLN